MKLARLLPAVLLIATALRAQPTQHVVGFMTDFDVKDDAIGICKAVMEGIDPGIRIIDISHQVTPYDIAEGARFLAGSAPYFPANSVFVIVIDPGVGSTRKAIVAHSRRGQYFVLPDNGLLTLMPSDGPDQIVEAREITNPAWMIGERLSSTFHGRDIFSPAGAHLARGENWTEAGPKLDVTRLVRLDIHNPTLDTTGLLAEVLGLDGPFGNVILNVSSETFAKLGYHLGDQVPVTLDRHVYTIPYVKTFSDVPVANPLLYIDSRGRVALSLNQRNFAEQYKVTPGLAVSIPMKK
jgi:S-adenosylmethionine hydrolase